MSNHDPTVNTGSFGKQGGDAAGIAGSGSGALAGDGVAMGSAGHENADARAAGLGGNAGAGAGSYAGASGGDVSDNTNIGSIDIS